MAATSATTSRVSKLLASKMYLPPPADPLPPARHGFPGYPTAPRARQAARAATVSWADRPRMRGPAGVQRGRMAKAAAGDVAAGDPQARVVTIPNAISLARLAGRAGVPVAGPWPPQPGRGLVGGRRC